MARIDGVNPEEAERQIKTVLDAQAKAWGNPLLNHLIYARRPTIFRGARAMWTGIEASQIIAPALRSLINHRVASLNGCEF
jgi:alkylhydroperoxidase family enzyme